jgi:hypothetical protein
MAAPCARSRPSSRRTTAAQASDPGSWAPAPWKADKSPAPGPGSNARCTAPELRTLRALRTAHAAPISADQPRRCTRRSAIVTRQPVGVPCAVRVLACSRGSLRRGVSSARSVCLAAATCRLFQEPRGRHRNGRQRRLASPWLAESTRTRSYSDAARREPWSIARFASSSAATSAPPILCTLRPAARSGS